MLSISVVNQASAYSKPTRIDYLYKTRTTQPSNKTTFTYSIAYLEWSKLINLF